MKRILLVGGGSGGHVYPLIAVADALREKSQQGGVDLELKLWGHGDFMINAAVEANLTATNIITGKIRRYFSFLNVLDFFKMMLGFVQSIFLMYWYMPDIVFAKGGSDSVMPAIAAKFYFIPLIIHESDSVPGLANRITSKIANKILVSFESSLKYFNPQKTTLVGNPVRRELAMGDKTSAANFFKLDPNKQTLLIMGGSQGAQRINQLVLDSIVQLIQPYQVIHQCGESQYAKIKQEIEKYEKEGKTSYGSLLLNNYKLFPFLNFEELKSAYALADIIVSRGGGQIFEIAMLGKPVIIIPLSASAGNHQLGNALEFSHYGASILEEENLTSHIFINQIQSLLKSENYQAISERIKKFAKPEAAATIAELLLD